MPKGYGYGGESTMKKKGAAPEMKGQHGMMMKDQGQPMMKHGKGPHMSAELKYNAIDDITQGKGKGDFPFTHKHTSNSASMMVDKSSPAGMHSPMHEGHKGGMPMHGALHKGHKGGMPMNHKGGGMPMNHKGGGMPMNSPVKGYHTKK